MSIKLTDKVVAVTTDGVIADAHQIAGGYMPVANKSDVGNALKVDGMLIYETSTSTSYRWDASTSTWVAQIKKEDLQSSIDGKAPISHANTQTTYGAASGTHYGHAKASSTTPKANSGSGSVGSETSSFARGDHSHPAQTNITGNAATADKLLNKRTIGISGGVTGNATTFDGSSSISIPVSSLDESYLSWGTKALSGNVSPIDAASSNRHSANRLAFANAAGITVEYSTDGSTFSTYDLTANDKVALVSGIGRPLNIGARATNNTVNDKLRITLDATKLGIYIGPKKLLIYITTNSAKGCHVKVEHSTLAAPTTFVEQGTYEITGWSGWNSIPLQMATFGGSSDQSTNIGTIRLTFGITGIVANKNNNLTINDLYLLGTTAWSTSSQMSKDGHLYSYDASQNASFPAGVSAANITLKTSGTADLSAGTVKLDTLSIPSATSGSTYTLGTNGAVIKSNGGTVYWGTDEDSKAASTNTSSKIFLIGATQQSATGQTTYSHDTAYVGTDGCLYSDSKKVLTEHQAVTNSAPTLSWGQTSTIGTVGGTALTVKMPANPNTDTTNTAGAGDTSLKIFLVGATSQTTSPQTFTHDTAYVGTDGCLYSNSEKVITTSGGTLTSGLIIDSDRGLTTPLVNSSNVLNVNAGSTLYLNRAASSSCIFKLGDAENARFNPYGHFIPGTTATYDIGATNNTWKTVYASTVQASKIHALTSSGGSTFGIGTSGQVLKSNGTNVYWGPDNNTTYGVVSTTDNGLAPKLPGGTTKYLRADGSWQVPPNTEYTHPKFTAKNSGIYKITVTDEGHISSAEAVTKSDITALGIPSQNTTYSIATASTAGLVKPVSVITKPTLCSVTTTSGRYYQVQMSSDGNMFVNVPWTDANTTYTAISDSTINALFA